MMDYSKIMCRRVQEIQPSGIRKYFDLLQGMEGGISLGIGEPDFPTPWHIRDAGIFSLEKGFTKYTPNAGLSDLRAAISRYLKRRFDLEYAPVGQILVTVGGSEGLDLTFRALLEPGDEVITFAPYFPEYNHYVNQTGAVLKVVPADTKQFQINFEALEKMLNPKTMALLVNTPNNPSGTVYSTETIERLAQLLEEKQRAYGHDIFLISDEPYRDIIFDGVDAPYISKYYDNSLSCYSFAKSLSIPGERLGYIAANPKCTDSTFISPMCAQISRGIGHNCPPSIIQIAVSEVLGLTSDLSVYETNMKIIYEELVNLGFEVVKPGGTFYIFPKALEEDSVAFCKKAMNYDLVLVPGDTFGCPGYFRMAYCIETEKVQRAMPALRRFVEQEYKH